MIEGIDLEDDDEVCNGETEPEKSPENEHSDVSFQWIFFFFVRFFVIFIIKALTYNHELLYHATTALSSKIDFIYLNLI